MDLIGKPALKNCIGATRNLTSSFSKYKKVEDVEPDLKDRYQQIIEFLIVLK